uniref:XS domain-containing protein n=1 Tax=Davidia involucrata TaxID=16924 RepID=A0A5B6Z536_DAVIN
MAGGNHPKGSSNKPSSSSSHRKSRWESGNNPPTDQKTSGAGDSKTPSKSSSNPKDNPTPKPGPTPSPSHPKPPTDPVPHPGLGPTSSGSPFPFPDGLGPPPPPAYGFHMLERRTVVLADGSVRSYFALPPDYQDFAPMPRPVDPSGRLLPHGLGLAGPELGFDKRFPPVGPMSPEFRDRDDPYMRNRNQDYWNSLGLDGRGGPMPTPLENSLKRKYGDEGERGRREEREGKDGTDEFARQRQQLLQYGNAGLNPNGYPMGSGKKGGFSAGTSSPYPRDVADIGRGDEFRAGKYMRIGEGYENLHPRQSGVSDNMRLKHHDVDQGALKKAFLHYVKVTNENASQRENYLEDGKQGPLQCVACVRSSNFPDMHSLIMHTYNSDSSNLHVDHLGLHKALCVVMGWNYSKPPDNSKAYQLLSADEAAANQDDLIMWPPVVIIHNTITGKSRDGRMEGLGNKAMDNKLRDLGFGGGKSKSLYGRDGHLGITLVKFAGDQSGLKEAVRLAEYFEKDYHGRKGWTRVQALTSGKDDDNNPNLVKVDEKTGEKKRVFYGYIGTAADLDKVDFETRKKVMIESQREYKPSK